MTDIIETVNAHADEVRARHDASVSKKRNQKRAAKDLRIRAVESVVAVVVLCLLGGFGLISWLLVLPLLLFTAIRLAVWFGAWLQFTYSKGGLLR